MRIRATLCALAAACVCCTSFAADVAERFLHLDGGISTPRAVRFVHPLCSYCKVEVTFNAIRDSEGTMVGSDSDVVVQVSKPYLEPMFMD
jgi:hypothetical protein